MLSVGNLTRDSDQISQRHDSVRNSVGPSWNCQNSWMHERCFRSSGRSLWSSGRLLWEERGIIELTEMLQFPIQHHQHIHLWNPWNWTTGHNRLMTSMLGRELCVFITKPVVSFLVSVLISLHQAGLIWISNGGIPRKVEIDKVL